MLIRKLKHVSLPSNLNYRYTIAGAGSKVSVAVNCSLESRPTQPALPGSSPERARQNSAEARRAPHDQLSFVGLVAILAGQWEWGAEVIDARLRDDLPNLNWITLAAGRAMLMAWRNRPAEAAEILAEIRRRLGHASTYQDRWGLHATEFWVASAAGDGPRFRRDDGDG